MKRKALQIVSPLRSWDVYADYFERIPSILSKQEDILKLKELQEKYRWKLEVEGLLDQDYQALVITDQTQTIQWVNNGFSTMTGYDRAFAVGKRPKFLQGPKTSIEVRARIREKIQLEATFTEKIINYRKNGEPYVCEVKIYPIRNFQNTTTHYLALEREIRAA